MARPASYQRDEAIEVIRKLTTQYGLKTGVGLARQQFPHVPIGTWGRWRQLAVGNITDGNSRELNTLAAEVRRSIPSPVDLAAKLPAARKSLDFWGMLDELEQDARLLRDFALARNADGVVKVKVPFALRDAHKMRCDLIRIALQQAEVAWSTERAANFYQTIIDEIAAESPDCQRRIMTRLKTVQGEAAARGF